MRTSIGVLLLLNLPAVCQEIPGQPPAEQPKLKQRTELPGNPRSPDQPRESANGLWIVPAGTKIPIQLRQAVSTKNAQPGDPIYAQTTFPIVVDDVIMIPAGTYVKGVVDTSKRAGRIKGKGGAAVSSHVAHLRQRLYFGTGSRDRPGARRFGLTYERAGYYNARFGKRCRRQENR